MNKEQFLNPDPKNAFLQLEPTNICNHNCVFCANSKITAPRRFMEKDLAMRLIKEAYEMGVRRGTFLLFGEPLLCPDIFDYYRTAADIGYRQLRI
ncbi:radical SAM protein [Lachnospiraceae bacterium C1.1]|nr:radical SAM protein [Lachnospiraceae bacterium C1.1]